VYLTIAFMAEGIIFSIEEFAVHDGPGIRMIIFFKGCPLRCVWCHNPEGISFKPEYLEKPTGKELCGYTVSAKELADKMLKNKAVLEMGAGGITISGGEPLAQPDFLIELLQMTAPLHRAIETSGFAPLPVFKEVVSHTDMVLFDIKQTDEKKHLQYTGASNQLILENLDHLCSSGKEFVARIPLIPGMNDDEENMETIVSILRNAKSLIRVEFLRYNKFAGAKYRMSGREFRLSQQENNLSVVEGAFSIPLELFKKNNLNTLIV
jgi:pyruvate formate lyase activating enzyme